MRVRVTRLMECESNESRVREEPKEIAIQGENPVADGLIRSTAANHEDNQAINERTEV